MTTVTTLSSSKTTKNAVELPFELVTSECGTILVLRGRLGVQQARPLWDCLQSALCDGTNVQLDAKALDGMDTSIVQILCRAAKANNPVRIGRISEGFTNALKLRGLENYFVPVSPGEHTSNQIAPVLETRTPNQSRSKRKSNA